MNLELLTYLVLKMDSIKTTIEGTLIILVVLYIIWTAAKYVCLFVEQIEEDALPSFLKGKNKAMFSAIVILGILQTFMPSTKEIAIITILPKIAHNKQVQKLPSNTLNLLNSSLEKWTRELNTDIKKRLK